MDISDISGEVTSRDVRAARDAWFAARDRGAPAERVAQLRENVKRLSRVEAQQLAGRTSVGNPARIRL